MAGEGPDPDRFAIAAAVSDGQPVDWDRVIAGATTEDDRAFLQRLRSIAAISAVTGPTREGLRQPGEAWGPLRVLDWIGSGSFGDVYRAFDPRLEREVALKILRHRDFDTGSHVIHEARLMARVRHPNVVTIFGAERIGDETGIWMELLPALHLAARVGRDGPLELTDAVRVAGDVAGALEAIHAAGLLHRDIKPHNVLTAQDGRAVLTDFGTGGDADGSHAPAGTPLYIAPEVLVGGRSSEASDLYSLGVLLYFLLTGTHPVPGGTLEEVRQQHQSGRYPDLRSFRAFPRPVAAIVARALAADPAGRFESASAMRKALTAAIAPPRWRTSVMVTGMALVVGLGTVLAWREGARAARSTAPAFVKANVSAEQREFGGISPDGSVIVCGGPSVPFALCDLASGAVTPIPVDPEPGPPRAAFALFSPDGRQILYMRRIEPDRPTGRLSLHLVDRDGSNDRPVFTPTADTSFLRPGGWTAGRNVVVADLRRHDGSHDLVLFRPADGSIQTVRRFAASEPVESMAISHDGRFIVHDLGQGDSWTRDLVAIDTANGQTWTLVDGDGDDVLPFWSSDASRLFFSSDRAGTRGLWVQHVVDGRALGEPLLIADTGRDRYSAAGSVSGGERILFLKWTGGFDGYRTQLDLSGGPMPVRRLSPRALDEIASPDWSPDGSALAYLSSPSRFGNRPGMTKVVIQDAAGRELDWPVNGRVHQMSLRWWPDGQSLLIRGSANDSGVRVAELRDRDTGRTLRTFPLAAPSGDAVPLTDGSALIYTTRSAVRELRLSDLRDSVLVEVPAPWSLNQTSGISLSRSGDRIAVSIVRQDPALAAAITFSRASRVAREIQFPVRAFPVGWADDDVLLAVPFHPAGGRAQMFSYSEETGQTRDLGLHAEQLRQLRIHPDGRQLLFSAGQQKLEFWWLQNAER